MDQFRLMERKRETKNPVVYNKRLVRSKTPRLIRRKSGRKLRLSSVYCVVENCGRYKLNLPDCRGCRLHTCKEPGCHIIVSRLPNPKYRMYCMEHLHQCQFPGCQRVSNRIDGFACADHTCEMLNCDIVVHKNHSLCKKHKDVNPYLIEMEQIDSMIQTLMREMEEAKKNYDEFERKRRTRNARSPRKRSKHKKKNKQ